MNRVRELRARSGMQQKELALAVGIARPTVSEWEHQKKDPTGERLNKLTEIFGVNRGVILCYEDIPNPVPVLFVDDGSTNVGREIEEARRLVQQDPERGTLFAMATTADIKNVRRAIAVLNALQSVE
jgi:transcriptional regulator with XRE-family HTH domain